MHIYTLVITPGPRRSAVLRAEELLDRAVPRYCDYWRIGGRFDDRLGKVEQPELHAWYAAQAERRERFEAEYAREFTGAVDYDARELVWDGVDEPHWPLLRRLQHRALIDLTRLASKLPSRLPESMAPAALVTPDARWRIRPVKWDQGDPRWARWVSQTIDRYRGGHSVVVADCHC